MRQRAGFCFCAILYPRRPTPLQPGKPQPITGFHRRPFGCWGPSAHSPGLPKGPRGSSNLTGAWGGKSPLCFVGKHKAPVWVLGTPAGRLSERLPCSN